MTRHLSMLVRPELSELRRVDTAVEELSVEEDWPPNLTFQINLVLEELVINVINYGFPEGVEPHDIELDIDSTGEAVEITIADRGRAFNPFEEAPKQDTTSALEDRAVGGLGVYLVKTMCDETEYRRDGAYNRIRLLKRR